MNDGRTEGEIVVHKTGDLNRTDTDGETAPQPNNARGLATGGRSAGAPTTKGRIDKATLGNRASHSTTTIGPVRHARTLISRSETSAIGAAHLAQEVVEVAGKTTAVAGNATTTGLRETAEDPNVAVGETTEDPSVAVGGTTDERTVANSAERKESDPVMHTTNLLGTLEHRGSLNEAMIEWMWSGERRISLSQRS